MGGEVQEMADASQSVQAFSSQMNIPWGSRHSTVTIVNDSVLHIYWTFAASRH